MSSCPSVQELELLAAGAREAAAARAHLERCPQCSAKVQEIRCNNELLAELAGSVRDAAAINPHVASSMSVEGYELLEPLGQGTQGAVYKAVQKSTRRTVAIKFLLGGHFATERRLGRFDREVELAAGLRHPNIVTVFHSGVSKEGRHFFAMEFVEGAPLGEFLDQASRTVRDTLLLFNKICSAVEYAHQRGIIHRDLKPANILIDAAGEPRIVDFGLAKLAGTEQLAAMTQTGEFAGTFAYASPEQTLAKPEFIDTRSDVYSLGVILYEMLTGALPYPSGGALPDVLRAIAQSAPRSPSAIRPEIDGEVETIVLKALAKEPSRRYQSAGQLARDVERYLAGEPIDAKRDSAFYMLSKTIRRHRIPFSLAGAAVIVLAVVAVAMSLAYRRAATAESTAAARSRDLARLLSISNIERGRAMGQAGNAALAEDLLWREFFAEGKSGESSTSPARWALRELYARQPCLATQSVPVRDLASAAIAADGRTVALLARGSHEIQIWDLPARQLVRSVSCASVPDILAISDDARLVACGCLDGEVYVWNVHDGSVRIAGHEHRSRIKSLIFSPDGRSVASGDSSGRVILRDTIAPHAHRELSGHTDRIRALAFTSNGGLLATSSDDRTVRLWDTHSGVATVAPITAVYVPVTLLAIDGDDKTLATIGDEVVIWDTPGLKRRQTLRSPKGAATSMEFSPDSSLLAIGSTDRNIQLWKPTDNPQARVLGGHTGPVNWVKFSADGAMLLSLSLEDRTLRRWEIRDDACLSTLAGHSDTVQSACYSADGTMLASASGGNRILLWDVSRSNVSAVFECDSIVYSVALSKTGLLAAAQQDGTIALFDTSTRGRVATLKGHQRSVSSVAFAPDGGTLASTSQDQTLRLWDPRSGACLRVLDNAREPLSRVAFSPDGKLVAAGGKSSEELVVSGSSQRNRVWVWEVADGALRHSFSGHRAPVRTVCFAPDGRTLASGSDDQTVRLWNLASDLEAGVMEGHRHGVFGLSFRADGRILASAGAGGEIKLWSVEDSRCLASFARDDATVFGVHMSPDGSSLTSWGADRLVTIWNFDGFDQRVRGNEEFWRQRLAPQ
ncbi:MAG: WD40 repeat domain-containing serine/threonine-protein kinase [Tepidisphaeraceae bacterium]